MGRIMKKRNTENMSTSILVLIEIITSTDTAVRQPSFKYESLQSTNEDVGFYSGWRTVFVRFWKNPAVEQTNEPREEPRLLSTRAAAAIQLDPCYGKKHKEHPNQAPGARREGQWFRSTS